MKHALVIADPSPGGFSATIRRTYLEALEEMGEEAVVRDLYAIGFDPVLKPAELGGAAGYAPGADVVAERALLAQARVFAFVYPLWFDGPPAILKGYVDRVFGMDFGYGPAPDGAVPLLSGRRLISFSCGPAGEALPAAAQGFDKALARLCRLSLDEHVHFTEVGADQLERYRAGARSAIERCFMDEDFYVGRYD